MKKFSGVFIFILVFSFLMSGLGFAEGLQSVGFLAGYMEGDLKKQDDYQVVPLMVNFGFDLKPLTRKIGFEPKGILEFQIEPFLSPVLGPKTNLETGVSLMFKYGFPLTERLMPYIKLGAGPSYMTLHTKEQGTQFNFVDTGVAGLSWMIKDDISIDCEYRYRHLSNCSIDDPNGGINTQAVLMGFTYRYD